MSREGSKSQLKARMLEDFRDVEQTGDALVVTSHGRPVLRITRVGLVENAASLFGDVRGHVRLPANEELTAPTGPEEWADSDLRELVG
jgi:hypothetical protein